MPSNKDGEDSNAVADMMGMTKGLGRKRSVSGTLPRVILSPPQKNRTPFGSRKTIPRIGGRRLRRYTRGSRKELDLRPLPSKEGENRRNTKSEDRHVTMAGGEEAGGGTLDDEQNETEAAGNTQSDIAQDEGAFINKDMKLKRKELVCPHCNKTGTMTKNGGAYQTRRTCKCKECLWQVAGQNLVPMIEELLGHEWKVSVWPKGTERVSPKGNEDSVTVPRQQW